MLTHRGNPSGGHDEETHQTTHYIALASSFDGPHQQCEARSNEDEREMVHFGRLEFSLAVPEARAQKQNCENELLRQKSH